MMMKEQSISVFLPVRKGSQRVINKNTRPFANFKNGLLELKLEQLSKLSSVDEVVVSTNDELCIEITKKFANSFPKIKVIVRPDFLATDSVDLVDLVKYVPSICKSKHILWTHVTSPFVNNKDYERAISDYFTALNSGFDSLMSVQIFKNFLWDKNINDIVNRCSNIRWPRTQDLRDLYEIDSAIFLASANTYINEFDRIGLKPYLFIQEKIKSFDIDWNEDFEFAEIIYNNKYNKL